MHKNSREAGMQKIENFALDILKMMMATLKNSFKTLAINMVAIQIRLLKNKMSSMVANKNCLFKRMSYTKAADLQYLVLTMTIYNQIMLVVCVVQVSFTKKFVILWLLKKGLFSSADLRDFSIASLGEDCLASLGKNALLPCGGKCLVSKGKNALMISKAHCQTLLDFSAWLPGRLQLGILEDFTAWLPRRGLQLGSPEEDFSLAS